MGQELLCDKAWKRDSNYFGRCWTTFEKTLEENSQASHRTSFQSVFSTTSFFFKPMASFEHGLKKRYSWILLRIFILHVILPTWTLVQLLSQLEQRTWGITYQYLALDNKQTSKKPTCEEWFIKLGHLQTCLGWLLMVRFPSWNKHHYL